MKKGFSYSASFIMIAGFLGGVFFIPGRVEGGPLADFFKAECEARGGGLITTRSHDTTILCDPYEIQIPNVSFFGSSSLRNVTSIKTGNSDGGSYICCTPHTSDYWSYSNRTFYEKQKEACEQCGGTIMSRQEHCSQIYGIKNIEGDYSGVIRYVPEGQLAVAPRTLQVCCKTKEGAVSQLLWDEKCELPSQPEPEESTTIASTQISSGFPNFTFQIPIPRFPTRISLCERASDGTLECPGIAKYITGIYKWLIGIAVVFAMLALTWGGVRWLLSGGESGKIQEAKKIIMNALIGLLLALGSFVLLTTVGKDYVTFRPLRVAEIQELNVNYCETDQGKEKELERWMKNNYVVLQPDPANQRVTGFSHLRFTSDAKNDLELHRKLPFIHPLLIDLLKKIDENNFKVGIMMIASGPAGGVCFEAITRKARDEGRWLVILGKPTTLIKLAKFLQSKQDIFPMELLSFFPSVVRPVEKCRILDNPDSAKDKKFNAFKKKYKDQFDFPESLFLVLGCEGIPLPPTGLAPSASKPSSPAPSPSPTPPAPPPAPVTPPSSTPPKFLPPTATPGLTP